jgi:hypothetical protein
MKQTFMKIATIFCLTGLLFAEEISQNKFNIPFLTFLNCGEVAECLILNIGKDSEKSFKLCQDKVKDCDARCLEENKAFEDCTLNCTCKNTDEPFPIACFNDCKARAKNVNFIDFINCIYAPCMPSSLSAGFIVLIIISIISVILLFAVAGIFFYKWKTNKSGSIDEARAFNKINF